MVLIVVPLIVVAMLVAALSTHLLSIDWSGFTQSTTNLVLAACKHRLGRNPADAQVSSKRRWSKQQIYKQTAASQEVGNTLVMVVLVMPLVVVFVLVAAPRHT